MRRRKKSKVCTSKITGKRVSCKRQRAGRKAARSKKRGSSGLGKICYSKITGKRVSCKRQRAGRKAARSRKR